MIHTSLTFTRRTVGGSYALPDVPASATLRPASATAEASKLMADEDDENRSGEGRPWLDGSVRKHAVIDVTSTRKVTFNNSFQLPGMDGRRAPGTFDVIVDTVVLDVPWHAARTTLTLMLPRGLQMEAWPISSDELQALLSTDADTSISTGLS